MNKRELNNLNKRVEQLATLLQDNEVIEYICDDCNYDSLVENLCENLLNNSEGFYMQPLTDNIIITEYDSRGEKVSLMESLFYSLDKKQQDNFFEENKPKTIDFENYSCKKNRLLMCDSLGLKEYATKEDILSKLSELL